MNAFFAANRLSQEEKDNILSQHRTLYDGYRTLQSNVSNEQPLYVQDFAKDKVGAVLNNKGVAKPYTNVGINEQVESKEVCDECGAMQMSEGECMECGWKGEVGAMEEQFDDELVFGDEDMEVGDEISSFDTDGNFLGAVKQNPDMEIEKPKFREGLDLRKSFEKFKGMMEATGKLSDIYNVEDLGDSDFDYVEGGGNDYGTFEKMHHMKKIKSEQEYEDSDNEDDGFEDLQADGGEMYEGGYTGGGNAPDMDISNIKPAYDFVSNGPDEVYPTEGEMEEGECDECWEKMESAWTEEIDELDVSGVQGIYGAMDPAYDFDSEGPGKAGPYQTSSWNEEYEGEDEDVYHVKDLLPGELDLDIEKFNPEDKSWEEIKAYTGNWDEIDEDIRESFISKKNKVMEMMLRMKVLK